MQALRVLTKGTWPGCQKGTPATGSHLLPQASTVRLLDVSAHQQGVGDTPTSGLASQPLKHMSLSRGERVSLTQAQMERACMQRGHAKQGTMPGEARGVTWPSLPSNGRGHRTHKKSTPPDSPIVKHIAATREMHQAQSRRARTQGRRAWLHSHPYGPTEEEQASHSSKQAHQCAKCASVTRDLAGKSCMAA